MTAPEALRQDAPAETAITVLPADLARAVAKAAEDELPAGTDRRGTAERITRRLLAELGVPRG